MQIPTSLELMDELTDKVKVVLDGCATVNRKWSVTGSKEEQLEQDMEW